MPGTPRLLPPHGAGSVALARIEGYNAELRDGDGFLGDRASKRAFAAMLDRWRGRLQVPDASDLLENGHEHLLGPDLAASGAVFSAVEELAQELAGILRRLLGLEEWRGTGCVVIGGGLRSNRIGALAVARTAALLHDGRSNPVELRLIRNDPDDAGLIGAAHLIPEWLAKGHDSILAADVGGTNIRVGIVGLGSADGADLAKAAVLDSEVWRHGEEEPSRDEAVAKLGGLLRDMAERAAGRGCRLAPFIGIGCPGVIEADGTIDRGGQNLPGDWEGRGFSLPDRVQALLPTISGAPTQVLLHNDAVLQGLSEAPFLSGMPRWGVLTVGTGLGNACFSARR